MIRLYGTDGLRALWAAAVVLGHYGGKLSQLGFFGGGIYTVSCFFVLTGATTTGSFIRQWEARKFSGWQPVEITAFLTDYVMKRCVPSIVLLFALVPLAKYLKTSKPSTVPLHLYKTPLFVGWFDTWDEKGSMWPLLSHTWFVSVCMLLWIVTPVCYLGLMVATKIGRYSLSYILSSIGGRETDGEIVDDFIIRILMLICTIIWDRIISHQAMLRSDLDWYTFWPIYVSSKSRLPQYMMGVSLAWILSSPLFKNRQNEMRHDQVSVPMKRWKSAFAYVVDLFISGSIIWFFWGMKRSGKYVVQMFEFDVWTIVALGLLSLPECKKSMSVHLLENRFMSRVLSGGGTLLIIYVLQPIVAKSIGYTKITPASMTLLWLWSYFLSICLFDQCAMMLNRYLSLQKLLEALHLKIWSRQDAAIPT